MDELKNKYLVEVVMVLQFKYYSLIQIYLMTYFENLTLISGYLNYNWKK